MDPNFSKSVCTRLTRSSAAPAATVAAGGSLTAQSIQGDHQQLKGELSVPKFSDYSARLDPRTSSKAQVVAAWEELICAIMSGLRCASDIGCWLSEDANRNCELAAALAHVPSVCMDTEDARTILHHLLYLPVAVGVAQVADNPNYGEPAKKIFQARPGRQREKEVKAMRVDSCRQIVRSLMRCMHKQGALKEIGRPWGRNSREDPFDIFTDEKCYLTFFEDCDQATEDVKLDISSDFATIPCKMIKRLDERLKEKRGAKELNKEKKPTARGNARSNKLSNVDVTEAKAMAISTDQHFGVSEVGAADVSSEKPDSCGGQQRKSNRVTRPNLVPPKPTEATVVIPVATNIDDLGKKQGLVSAVPTHGMVSAVPTQASSGQVAQCPHCASLVAKPQCMLCSCSEGKEASTAKHVGGPKMLPIAQLRAKMCLDPLEMPKLTVKQKTIGDDDFWLHTQQDISLLADPASVVQPFQGSILTSAISLAYPEVTEMLNKCGMPFDQFFEQGKKLRVLLGLPISPPPNQEEERLRIFCRPMMDDKCREQVLEHWKKHKRMPFIISPVVLQVLGVLSEDVLQAVVDRCGELDMCPELTGTGRNCVRAAVLRKVEPDDGLADRYPIFRAGSRAAIVGTKATELEATLMALQEEFGLLLARATDEKMRMILGMEMDGAEGYWKFPYRHHLQKAGIDFPVSPGCVKETEPMVHLPDSLVEPGRVTETEPMVHLPDSLVEPQASGPVANLIDGCAGTDGVTRKRAAQQHHPQRAVRCRRNLPRRLQDSAPREDSNWRDLLELSKVGGLPPEYVPGLRDYQVNLAYLKCGPRASEGKHTDLSALLTSRSEKAPTLDKQGKRMPTQRTLSVGTLCIGPRGYLGITELIHMFGGKIYNKTYTDRNSMHIQSEEIQNMFEHLSNVILASLLGSIGNRYRFTMRNQLDCCWLLIMLAYMRAAIDDSLAPEDILGSKRHIYSGYECRMDPSTGKRTTDHAKLKKKEELWFTGMNFREEVGEGGDTTGDAPVKITKFKQLTLEELRQFQQRSLSVLELLRKEGPDIYCQGIPRPQKVISFRNSPPAVVARKACAVRDLLNAGMVPQVMDGALPSEHSSIRMADGVPYHAFQALDLEQLPMLVSSRSEACIFPADPSLLFVTKPYKNPVSIVIDLHAMLAYEMHLFDLRSGGMGAAERQGNEIELQERFDSLPPLLFGYCGGSHMLAGAFGFSVSSSRTNDPHTVACHPQDPFSAENMAMENLFLSGNIVSVCVDQKEWFEHPRDASFFEKGSEKQRILTSGGIDRKNALEWLSDQKAGCSNARKVGWASEKDGPAPIMGTVHHLFHYTAERVARRDKDNDGILSIAENTIHLPGYAAANVGNCSYAMTYHKALVLRPALSFEQEMHLLRASSEPDKNNFTILPVSDKLKDILVCPAGPLVESLETDELATALGFKQFPLELVRDEDIYQYLFRGKTDRLVDVLRDPGVLGERYTVDVGSVPALMMSNMVAAAIRSSPDLCLRLVRVGLTETEQPIPIIGQAELVDQIPAPLRQKPSPCCNRDKDVTTCLFRHNFDVVLKLDKWHGHSFVRNKIQSFDSLCVPDLTSVTNRGLVTEAFYTAILGRLLSPAVPCIYAVWKGLRAGKLPCGVTCLPGTEEAGLFCRFIRVQTRNYKDSGWVFNKQHNNVIPASFKSSNGMATFCRFASEYALSGTLVLDRFLAHLSSLGGTDPKDSPTLRREVFQVVLSSLVNCGAYFRLSSDLSFLVHVAMADMESKVPGLFGLHTTETVHFGTGSTNGILLCLPNSRGSLMDKFVAFHRELSQLLLAMQIDELSITGYTNINGKLYSIFTGRVYSYTDSEHILCKIYVCLELSHTSRTISELPKCYSPSTWPIPSQCRFWCEKFSLDMQTHIIDSFLRVASCKPSFRTYIRENYPRKLTYSFPDHEVPSNVETCAV